LYATAAPYGTAPRCAARFWISTAWLRIRRLETESFSLRARGAVGDNGGRFERLVAGVGAWAAGAAFRARRVRNRMFAFSLRLAWRNVYQKGLQWRTWATGGYLEERRKVGTYPEDGGRAGGRGGNAKMKAGGKRQRRRKRK